MQGHPRATQPKKQKMAAHKKSSTALRLKQNHAARQQGTTPLGTQKHIAVQQPSVSAKHVPKKEQHEFDELAVAVETACIMV